MDGELSKKSMENNEEGSYYDVIGKAVIVMKMRRGLNEVTTLYISGGARYLIRSEVIVPQVATI